MNCVCIVDVIASLTLCWAWAQQQQARQGTTESRGLGVEVWGWQKRQGWRKAMASLTLCWGWTQLGYSAGTGTAGDGNVGMCALGKQTQSRVLTVIGCCTVSCDGTECTCAVPAMAAAGGDLLLQSVCSGPPVHLLQFYRRNSTTCRSSSHAVCYTVCSSSIRTMHRQHQQQEQQLHTTHSCFSLAAAHLVQQRHGGC
jgi:hypothetical protein